MKSKLLIAAAGGALLFSSAGSAQAQSQQGSGILERLLGSVFGSNQQASEQTLEADWNQQRRPFAQRRAVLESRIDAAVRDGSLGRREADDMRREYDDIVRLEAQYSAAGGMSQQERSDLRMRYRALSQRVDGQGYGQGSGRSDERDEGRWQPMSTRAMEFEQRIAAGLRDRSLTRMDATRLRSDWQALAQVEASYQRGGIDSREEADLVARYDALEARLGGGGGSAGGGPGGGFGDDRNTARWAGLEARLADAERGGRVSRSEIAQMRAQLSDLARLDAAYAVGGYNTDERTYLTRRYGEIDQMLGYNRR